MFGIENVFDSMTIISLGKCNDVQPLMPYTAKLERSILASWAGFQISKFLDARLRGYDESRLENKEI
jgi:hypothetical protein